MKQFKLILREYCQSKGIALAWVARQVDVDDATIHNWSSNRTTPRLENFLSILGVLNCQVQDIIQKVEIDEKC